MDSVDGDARDGDVDCFLKLDIRRRPLLDDARREASDLSTDGNERARRKAGMVFERLKEGREDEEVEVVLLVEDIGSGSCWYSTWKRRTFYISKFMSHTIEVSERKSHHPNLKKSLPHRSTVFGRSLQAVSLCS
jgi:hypothetical protein